MSTDKSTGGQSDDWEARLAARMRRGAPLSLPPIRGTGSDCSSTASSRRSSTSCDQRAVFDTPRWRCSICLRSGNRCGDGDGRVPSTVTRLPCRHAFHTGCIEKWFHTNRMRACPLCRVSCSQSELISSLRQEAMQHRQRELQRRKRRLVRCGWRWLRWNAEVGLLCSIDDGFVLRGIERLASRVRHLSLIHI